MKFLRKKKEGIKEEYSYDLFGDYDYVQLLVQEMEVVENDEFAIIDLSNLSNFRDINYQSYELFMMMATFGSKFIPIKNDELLFTDLNGKLLFKRAMNEQTGEDEFFMGDVSSEDDVIIELTDEDKEILYVDYSINVEGYSRLILRFGDVDYNADDLVVDYDDIDSINSYSKINTWRFAANKKRVNKEYFHIDVVDENEEGIIRIKRYHDGYYEFYPLRDLTYEDNMIIYKEDDSETFDCINQNLGINLNKILIVFKDPEFIEGDNQEYNSEKDEGLTFRLNIPFDKFEESGEVYLDDELVDSKNYTATEGSTIITFKKNYLKDLDLGEHTLRVNVVDGTATATFNIVEGSASKDPETGDNLILYLGLILLSITGIYSVKQRLV